MTKKKKNIKNNIFFPLIKWIYDTVKNIYKKIIFYPKIIIYKLLKWRLNLYQRYLENWGKRTLGFFWHRIGVLFISLVFFFFLLKGSAHIFYDPIIWPNKEIGEIDFEIEDVVFDILYGHNVPHIQRKSFINIICFIIVFLTAHLLGWIFLPLHEHFKFYWIRRYYDIASLWMFYHLWYTNEIMDQYLEIGVGLGWLVYYIWYMSFIYWGQQAIEFLEIDEPSEGDEEDDFDLEDEKPSREFIDQFREIKLIDPDTGLPMMVELDEELELQINNSELAELDRLMYDLIDEPDDLGENIEETDARFHTWNERMTRVLLDEEEELELELQEIEVVYMNEKPRFKHEYYYYSSWAIMPYGPVIYDAVDDDDEEYYNFWMYKRDQRYIPYIYPWWTPLKLFFLTTLRTFYTIPFRRNRAVGEYSRYNFRFKRFTLKYRMIRKYTGVGNDNDPKEYFILIGFIWSHIWFVIFYIYCIIRKIFSIRFWIGFWTFWKLRWKLRGQIKKLRKWGSQNYVFIGSKIKTKTKAQILSEKTPFKHKILHIIKHILIFLFISLLIIVLILYLPILYTDFWKFNPVTLIWVFVFKAKVIPFLAHIWNLIGKIDSILICFFSLIRKAIWYIVPLIKKWLGYY